MAQSGAEEGRKAVQGIRDWVDRGVDAARNIGRAINRTPASRSEPNDTVRDLNQRAEEARRQEVQRSFERQPARPATRTTKKRSSSRP